MNKKFFAISFIAMFFSCTDKKINWLTHYSSTKCAYQTEMEKFKSDSAIQITPLLKECEELQKKLVVTRKPFETKIAEIEDKKTLVQKEYMKAYRKEEEKQSTKYGHVSTPAYEKKINQLEKIKNVKNETLQQKITLIRNDMESQSDFISLTQQISTLNKKINNVQEGIAIKHKKIIDSLQQMLNVENANYNVLKKELNSDEQKNIELSRDSVRANPCK
jgi:hypothetical protein